MGIVEAIEYKKKCEKQYQHCRGTAGESFKILREDGFVSDSDNRLLNGIKNYSVRSGFTIEDKSVEFHCLAPSSREKDKSGRPCGVLFKNELGKLAEHFFEKMNKKLVTLCKSKKDEEARLDALLDILSKAIPRLQQLHIPMDGTGRTNLLLIHYLLAYCDLPPVVLMDPNATSILHKKRCKKIPDYHLT
ncbi:hypothetical protein GCM10023116_11140 [Kistimonas scapharcae]|uniref:Uncharacterized protein n=2 Tax=Kistimonas scapharcae TaxID=1036133 RepID=A0ABP8UYB8_9GAMM